MIVPQIGNRLLGFPVTRRLAALIVLAALFKIALAMITPLSFIFVNWVGGSARTAAALEQGTLPELDLYTGSRVFLGGLISIWSSLTGHAGQVTNILSHSTFAPTPEGFALVLLVKLPSILFDLLTAILIGRILLIATGSDTRARTGFALWFLNPVFTFMVEMWGTIEVIPAFLALLSVRLVALRKNVVSLVALAIGVFLRIFPLILLPVHVVFHLANSPRNVLRFLGTAAALLVVVLIMTYVAVGANMGALSLAAVEQFYILRLLGFPISGGIGPYDSPILLVLFLMPLQLYLVMKLWRERSPLSVGLVLVLTLLTAAFNEPYHFLWVMPFLVIDATMNNRRRTHLSAILALWILWTLTYADLSSSGNAFFFIPPFNAALVEAAMLLHGLLPLFAVLQIPFLSIFYSLNSGYLLRINLAMITRQGTNDVLAKQAET